MAKRRKSPVEIITTDAHMCSLDLRLKILSRLPFFRDLPSKAIEKINTQFVEKGYQPGAYLYFSDEPGRNIYVLAEGRARLLRSTAAGKQVMLDLLTSGDFFGALGSVEQPYTETAQAQSDICVLVTSVSDFRAVLKNYPGVALQVLDVLAARLQAAHDSIHLLSSASAETRIAHTLLKLSRKVGKSVDEGLLIDTPLGRDELAEMTGVTSETASRVISQFQKDGLIASGRQWVALTNKAALEELLDSER